MRKNIPVYVVAVLVIGTFLFFSSYTGQPPENKNNTANRTSQESLPQVVQAIKIPGDVNLAGEYVPLENFDAKERLDREFMVNCYWHSSTLSNLKYANRYFPIIERVLAENGVPDDFKYLAVAESSLRNAVSPAGARGIWQFMESSAKAYGLQINKDIDERYHIEKATKAARKYLKNAKAKFGTWTMAAASYNMGETRLRRLVTNQKQNKYYDLEMNGETSRYVSRIIAIKEIMKNPTLYGFYLDSDDYYPSLEGHRVIEVSSPVASWADFAQRHGTTYRMLKVYNPWLRTGSLTSTGGKTYKVALPY